MGIEASQQDDTLITFSYELTLEHVLNNTNQEALPEGLIYSFISAVCGKYISALYLSGKAEGIDFDSAFRSVHLGDTSVELSGLTGAEKYKLLTDTLNSDLEDELECYRKLRW